MESRANPDTAARNSALSHHPLSSRFAFVDRHFPRVCVIWYFMKEITRLCSVGSVHSSNKMSWLIQCLPSGCGVSGGCCASPRWDGDIRTHGTFTQSSDLIRTPWVTRSWASYRIQAHVYHCLTGTGVWGYRVLKALCVNTQESPCLS